MKKKFSERKLKIKLVEARDKYASEIAAKKYGGGSSLVDVTEYRAERIRFINEILQWIKDSHD